MGHAGRLFSVLRPRIRAFHWLGNAVARARDGLVQEVGVTYVGQMAASGTGFLVQLFLQRELGPGDYGILGLATAVGSLAGVATDLGVSHAMVRFGSKYLAEDPERAMPRFTASLMLRLMLAVVVTMVGYWSATFIAIDLFAKPALIVPLRWTYLGIVGPTLFSYWMFFIQAHQKFGIRSIVAMATAGIRVVLIGGIYLASWLSPRAIVVAEASTSFLGFVVGLRFSPRGLFRWRGEEIRSALVEIGPYCRFTGVLIVGDMIFNELDTLMLGVFAEQETVGLYRTAWTYAMVLGFLNMSVANVLFPKVTSVTDPASLWGYVRRILKLTSVLALTTLPMIPAVSWWIPWYQPDFESATSIFYIMYVGLVFELIFGPINYVLYSLNRPGVLVCVTVLKIGLNVAGNLVLIPIFGAHGAAAATVATRLLGGALACSVVVVSLKRHERAMINQ